TVGTNSWLLLWPLEKLVPLNARYKVSEFAPGLVLFGSDGGGEGYAFDTRQPTFPVVQVPLVGMSLKDTKVRGSSFSEFLRYLANQSSP
ncbi:MAG: SMI1/KNR4 family protein, partial [Nitrospira sp.]|nr:SMI1/KNR4 family protein [Nitrospira sp.]